MRGNIIIFSHAAMATALSATVLAVAAPASAQSSNTWSLPEPTAAPSAPRAQGPVDGQNPVVRPSAEPTLAPSPAPVRPAPSPVPTLRPAPPPPTRTAPASRPSASPSLTPTPTPAPAPSPTATASIAPETGPVASPTPVVPDAPTAPAADAAPPPAQIDTPPVAADGNSWPTWWWLAAGGVIAVLAGLFAFSRRRRARTERQDWAEPQDTAPIAAEAPPAPEAAPSDASAAFPPAPLAPQPAFTPSVQAPTAESLDLSFEPLGLRLSLVYATLRYRVTITAGAGLPAGHLIIGDVMGAHASIPPEQQLAPPLETLAKLKAVPTLAPGETATLTGELQLPLGAIRPLQQGNASFFVPLVRLYVVGEDGEIALRRVFTIGIDGGTATLGPVRLDTGPQEHRQLAAREVEAARQFPLQPAQHRAVG